MMSGFDKMVLEPGPHDGIWSGYEVTRGGKGEAVKRTNSHCAAAEIVDWDAVEGGGTPKKTATAGTRLFD